MSSAQQPVKAPPSQATAAEYLDTFLQRAIMGAVLFILVWAPLAFGSTDPGAFLVIQGVTVLAMALWGLRMWVQRPFRLFWPPVCWGVLAFLLYALARCQLVDVMYVGREQMTRVIVYAALFFIVLHNLNGKESATIVTVTLIAVGFCASFLAALQFVKHDATLWGMPRPAQYLSRGGGTFYNPNNFAGYLEMIVPLALAYTIMSRFSPTIKALLGYSVLAMLAGVVVTLSRGGILAVAASLLFLCLILVAQRDFWLPSLVALAGLLVIALVVVSQFDSMERRFVNGVRVAKADPSIRLDYWHAALQLYERHPVWGVGPGHYDVEFPQVRPWRVQDRPQYAHNDYLNALCEWGTVGTGIVALTCALLAWGMVETWNAVRRRGNDFGASRRSDRTAFLVGASAAIFAVLLHSTVEFNMQIPADAITAVVLMALIAAQGRFATEGYWKNPGLAGKVCLTILTGGAVYFLGAGAIHRGEETYWLRKAKGERVSADRALDCLMRAHYIEPSNPQTYYLLGESLRVACKEENDPDKDKAQQAVVWFGKGMHANDFDPRFPLRIGMCLDWMDRSTEATPYFDLAERLDTNNYYIALEVGRHFITLGDYATAKSWMEKSANLERSGEAVRALDLLIRNMSDPLFAPRK